MGYWPDPWDELSYFQEELLHMLDDQIGWVTHYVGSVYYELKDFFEESLGTGGDGLSGIIEDILASMAGTFKQLKDAILDLGSDILAPILDVFEGIGHTLSDMYAWVKDGFGKGIDYIVNTVSDMGGYVMDTIINAAGSVTDYVSLIWEGAKNFIAGQYDKITEFWYNIFTDLWYYLDLALTEIWVYFVDVVIPVFMDALAYVFESPPVQWLVGLFEKHILSVFTELLDIDEEDLQRWIQKSFIYMKTLAEGIKE